ncbi:MAG: toprim domain-containing protein [Burkholderiales bacterium]
MGLEDVLIQQTEDTRIKCPLCADSRKKNHEKTMGVKVENDRVVYKCFHFGGAGAVKRKTFMSQVSIQAKQTPKTVDPPTEHVPEIVTSFLAHRGIDTEVARQFPLVGSERYFAGSGKQRAIGFVYGDPRSPEAIKWRSTEGKEFTQQGSAKSFFGLNQLPEKPSELIICEGEMDVLALAAAGIAAVSVPNGAPSKISDKRVDPKDDGKFSFVWEARDLIDSVERVIFCPDNDEPGRALVEELARRIGRAKCWSVELPEKDANETLIKHGPESLRQAFSSAKPLPLEGVYLASDFESQIVNLWDQGVVKGASTGMDSLDKLYTILPGQLSVVTGLPGSGKSELIDQICVNIAMRQGWRFAIASFENPPHMHIAKLSEKIVGKPFFGSNRMTAGERDYALDFLNQHFVFLQSHDGAPSTVQSIIDRTKQAVMRMGVRGLVIDPYNYLDMGGDSEHSAISKMLTEIVLFCKSHEIHAWFVAHPAKQLPDSGVPKGQHISGSAAWFAKADMGVTVHRKRDETEVHVWKSRFKWVGSVGEVGLNYDIPTGRYSDKFDADWGIEL